MLAYGALNETAQPPWINGVQLHAHAKAAGAAVAALGRPRWQVPLVDLLFGKGKRLGVAYASTPRGEGGAGSLKFKTK